MVAIVGIMINMNYYEQEELEALHVIVEMGRRDIEEGRFYTETEMTSYLDSLLKKNPYKRDIKTYRSQQEALQDNLEHLQRVRIGRGVMGNIYKYNSKTNSLTWLYHEWLVSK